VTSRPVAPGRAPGGTDVPATPSTGPDASEALANWQVGGFGVYVHWPFCLSKCPYCDFNSHVRAGVDQQAYLEAYLRELDHWGERTPGRIVSSVFFGGGTPSLMEPSVTGAILDRIAGRWTLSNDPEITLEANPTSVEATRFQGFAEAGVNRFSVGIQSLRDEDLRRLGRLHSASEARRAYEVARGLSDRVSFDLIYARQDQSPERWADELAEALALGPDHLALYQLTIEEGTAFWERARAGGLRGLPDEDRSVALWDVTQELCESAGLRRYEVSNHAQAGQESRHNLVYWRAGDWLGIGPGAHGRLSRDGARHATANLRQPESWRRKVMEVGQGLEEHEALARPDVADEYVIFAMRLREGMSLSRLATLGGTVDPEVVARLRGDGLIDATGDRLRATETGTLVLNAVVAALRDA
jgi:oxygen-independent coproporphyrinogen-3 oxidase